MKHQHLHQKLFAGRRNTKVRGQSADEAALLRVSHWDSKFARGNQRPLNHACPAGEQ
jgi:hypothetical protein